MKRNAEALVLIGILAALVPGALPAEELSGQVIGVIDGDTIDVLWQGKPRRIRLAAIDCPEKRQAFGTRAKQFASDLAFGKRVTVEVVTVDRYRRTVAFVILPDGRNLNEEMLRAGMAWWYSDYSKDKKLAALERGAREARRGLWADPDPVPPWVFRRRD